MHILSPTSTLALLQGWLRLVQRLRPEDPQALRARVYPSYAE